MRAGSLLLLVTIAAATCGCTDASFGLGPGEDPETGSDVSENDADSVSLDTESPDTADGPVADSGLKDSAVAETSADAKDADAADTLVSDTFVPDTFVPDTAPDSIADSTDAAKPDTSDAKPPSRCAGKGVPVGHVAVIAAFLECCSATPPCCGRPTGYMAYAGSVDTSGWKNPYPGCTASSAGANSLMCDFVSGADIRFVVGIADTFGASLDTTAPLDGKVTVLACDGETELGYCSESGACSGKLSLASGIYKLLP